MLALEESELAHAKEAYEEYLREARLDQTETVDLDNQAQAETASKLAVALDMPVHDHAEKLEHLREIDFGPKTEVTEGAVIDIGGRLFVISVATAEFSCQGQKVMGISTQAPLYQALEGLSAGDSADVNGRAVTIEGLF